MVAARMGRPRKRPVTIDGVAYWRCANCGDYRPAKRFGPSKRTSNGLKSWCLDCCRRSQRRYRVRQSRTIGGVVQWRCTGCKEWLEAKHFWRDGRAANGLRSRCKGCTA